MPIYEYRCDNCGHELEAIQKISEPPLVDCPQCGAPQLRKRISAVAFRLKGGGWYETDFKSGQQKNLADRGSDKESSSGDGEKAAATASTGDASTEASDVGKDAKKGGKATEKAAGGGKAGGTAAKAASAAASD